MNIQMVVLAFIVCFAAVVTYVVVRILFSNHGKREQGRDEQDCQRVTARVQKESDALARPQPNVIP